MQNSTRCVVKSSDNAWMKELNTIWVKRVFGAFSFNMRLLAWDSYQYQMTDSVKKKLKEMNVDSVIIPGGAKNTLKHLCGGISHLKRG